VAPIRVAAGERPGRVMFKQQAQAIGVCQIDACRLGESTGLRRAAHGGRGRRARLPAGGVGLCSWSSLSIVDYLCERVLEGPGRYVDHLHGTLDPS
jgi:L-fuconate dehydratase